MKRALYLSLTVILAIISSAMLASASAPTKFVLNGAPLAHPVEITSPRDTGTLFVYLCSIQPAGNLIDRPSLDIIVQWDETTEDTWRGKFYPAIGDQPAAADIPGWTLYLQNEPVRHCNGSIVDAKALQVLASYGIPTQFNAPKTLPEAGGSLNDRSRYATTTLAGLLLSALGVIALYLSVGYKIALGRLTNKLHKTSYRRHRR